MSCDQKVEGGFEHLLLGGVHHEFVAEAADPYGSNRASPRNVRDGERGGCGVDCEHVGRVHLVDREHRRNHMDVVAHRLVKKRADGTVDHPAAQNGRFGGATFALNKPSGNLPGGVKSLFKINKQREKIYPGARFVGDAGCGKHRRFAMCRHNGSACLLCHFSGGKLQRTASNFN